jgi:hypothetical protein
LRNKTIFDFTSNSEIIKKIIGKLSKDYYIKCCHFLNKLSDIENLAIMTNNPELQDAAAKEWKKARAEWDNMIENGQRDGIIID